RPIITNWPLSKRKPGSRVVRKLNSVSFQCCTSITCSVAMATIRGFLVRVIAESDSVTGCRIPRAGIVYQVIVGRRLHPWPPADGSRRVLELQPPAAHTATVAPIRRRQAGREGSQGDS